MLEQALLRDMQGRAIEQAGPTASDDWDEVQEFCSQVYMPYRVRPIGKLLKPNATMRQAQVGRVTLSRFSYGVPIRLTEFDPEAGNVLVLNTLRGALRHKQNAQSDAVTAAGDSFVVDCSRTDYWLEGDAQHLQLNCTIPHDVLAEIAQRWFGFVPDDGLWTKRIAFGGGGSRWQALLAYVAQCIDQSAQVAGDTAMARHLEELLCVDLLQAWAQGAGISLTDGARGAAPYYVRRAEEIMANDAQNAPTIGEVAQGVGVSARTLSGGFRKYRGISPREFLRDRRLDGLHAELLNAPENATVTQIAAEWNYVNFGAMSRIYRQRFGENPSQTLRRRRRLS